MQYQAGTFGCKVNLYFIFLWKNKAEMALSIKSFI